MAEVQKPKDNGASTARKSVKDEVVPRLREAVGGTLGNALAEGLLMLEEQVRGTEDSVTALDGSIGGIRTRAAAALQVAKGAEDKASAAAEAADVAKRDAQDARDIASHSNTKAEEALGNASDAAQKAGNAGEAADNAVQIAQTTAAETKDALEKAERRNTDAVNSVGERVDSLTSRVEELFMAVGAFGRDLETALSMAEQASSDAQHATELIEAAGEQVRRIGDNTYEAVSGANARIDDVQKEVAVVRTSITPPPAKEPAAALPIDEVVRRAMGSNGRPTPKGGESEDVTETEILSEMAKTREARMAGTEALRLVKDLESRFNGLVAAVKAGFDAVDNKLQLLAMAAGASDEEVEAIGEASLELDEKR